MNKDIKKMAAIETAKYLSELGVTNKLVDMNKVAETGLLPAVTSAIPLKNPVVNLEDFAGQIERATEKLADHPCGEEMRKFTEKVKETYQMNLCKLEQAEQMKHALLDPRQILPVVYGLECVAE